MKKIICILFATIMCFSSVAVSAEDAVVIEFGDVAGMAGDVDVDTYITVSDMVALKKILLTVTKAQSILTADVNEDKTIDIRDMVRMKKVMINFGVADGAKETESYLANAYKLLTNSNNKITLGYLGGSITYGVGATYDGTIDDSWVNLTSAWFAEQFPDAIVETVNAGLPDTATNYALYRLEKCLMNTKGHDMPDVVFVEFTNNDWITATQSSSDLECQIESLFRNIYILNPCAEIIVVSTARKEDEPSRKAYMKVADLYNIPIIDVGTVLREKMCERGYENESSGNYYYTADNLHPSAKGYGVYFEEIKGFLEENVLDIPLKSAFLYNYQNHSPDVITANYIWAPKVIPASSLTLSGSLEKSNTALSCEMYGTDKVLDKTEIVSDTVEVSGTATVTATFTGSTLGLLFQLTSDTNINMTYSIDGRTEKTFAINENSYSGQRYSHNQVFMLAHSLDSGTHSVKFNFGDSDKCTLGAILTNQKTF